MPGNKKNIAIHVCGIAEHGRIDVRIAVAMSGELRSSLVAAILKLAGHEIMGLTFSLRIPEGLRLDDELDEIIQRKTNVISAKRIARHFNFPHKIIPVEEDYCYKTIEYIKEEYKKGRNPAAELICNRDILFRRLLDFAIAGGFKKIASGHYARACRSGFGRYHISNPVSREEGQSYQLCMLPREIIEYCIFPLGDYHRDAVKRLAGQINLPAVEEDENVILAGDSKIKFSSLIEKDELPPGDIVDTEGNTIGVHDGIHLFTTGREYKPASPHEEALHVIRIEAEKNRIVVGKREELSMSGLFAYPAEYMLEKSFDGAGVLVKTGAEHKPVYAKIKEARDGLYVYFREPHIPVVPGNAAVFYNTNGDILGSAWIEYGIK